MVVKIKWIILLLLIFYLPAQEVFSQLHLSKDNYTGDWETSSSWNPTWTVPQTTNLSGYDISINGYITVNGSLSFSGTASNLIINDTLVIKGNLLLENNTKVTVNDNGVLIVRGNLTISNQSILRANGYLIIAGDIIKNGSTLQGPFTSNDNPVKVFVGGNISSDELTDNYLNFPVLNCTTPITTPYPNSTCSYGNMTDIQSDPINSFYQYTCTKSNVSSKSPVCFANTIYLNSSRGTDYSWSGPNGFTSKLQNPFLPNANPVMAGAYTITVIAAPGCTDTDTINITVVALPSTPTIIASGPLTICASDSVTLTSSAGSTYLWSNGATTASTNVSSAGNYTVRVTDVSGCLSAASATTIVKVNGLPVTPTITAGGPTAFCDGGSVTLISSAGTGYLWSNGLTTASITVTTTGSYKVQVTNANGCRSAASVATIVTVNALPVTPTVTAGGPTTICTGGSVTLTSTAGTSYLWSNAAITPNIDVTAPGSYTVRVTNASGCQSAASVASIVTVNTIPATPAITAIGTTTFCTGGSVTLNSSAGTSYLWSNAAITQSINIIKAGSYTVKVTNASGCQSASSAPRVVTVNALPVIPTITAGGPTAFCTNGSVNLTSSAGTSYLWSNAATTQSINVASAGSYTVQVTTASGCLSPASVPTIVTVNSLPVPTISAGGPTTFCAGGSVTLNLTSTAGTSYLWSNAATTPSIDVSTAGSYTLQVTNASGCQSASSAATIVIVNALPVVDAGLIASIPVGTGTTIDASVTGIGPFPTYSWSPSALLADATIEDPTTNILATTTVFTLTATSITTGCSNTNSVTITISGGALSSTPTASPGTICAGTNVQLNAMASGGSGIYTYAWTSVPAGFTSSIVDPIVSPLVNTTYYVEVNDGVNTVNSQVAVIVNGLPATPTIEADNPTTFCSGGSEILTLTSSAGTSYLWSNTANSQKTVITTPGSYTVSVTNASGCLSAPSLPTVVTVNPLPVTPTITAAGPTAFCAGGSVTLTSSAGLNYLWSNGEPSQNIVVTTPGSYTVWVTNTSGCLSVSSVATIVTVNPLPATPTITPSGSTTFCAGGNVTLTSSAETSYSWSNGATTSKIYVTTPDNYNVKVTSASGCQSGVSLITKVSVAALPATPTITPGGPTTFCAGDSVILTSSAGTSYLWSNAETTQSINVSIAGSYTVKVTDATECQSAASVATVVKVNALPVIPTITAGGPTAFCTNGSVNLTSSAGTSYLWSNAATTTTTATTQSIIVTTAGSYTVQVTNASGCQSAASVATIVTVNALPVTTANSKVPVCEGSTLSLTGGPEGMMSYSWTGPNGFASILQNPTVSNNATLAMTGVYTLTVTNANGCSDTETVNITVNAVPIATAGSNSPVCADNTISLTSSGGKDYSWSGPIGFKSDKQNPSINDDVNNDRTGDYTVTVTAANGCSAMSTTSVTVNALPIATANSNSPVCVGNTINLTSSNRTGYIFSWRGPNGFTSSAQNPSRSNADSTMAGAYKVTVTAVTGCSAVKKTIVKVIALPIVSVGSNSPVCVDNTIDLTASGGNEYSWSGPDGFTSSKQNPSIPNAGTLMAGGYAVTVKATTGCTAANKNNVIIIENPVVSVMPDQELKFVFETEMQGVLSSSETGEWSIISGSGRIGNINSPTTRITELSTGENILLWKVRIGNCEAASEVKITVYDPFIPSVITPDGDGKNEYFKIDEYKGKVEMIIFNRWGVQEYTNSNYENNWDGRNYKGLELPNDTYFYILKFENIKIKKGSVLIKR